MTGRVYKTAQGKTLDMGALILQNEKVRAVGNMKVNARGDAIDERGNIIDSKNQQVQRQYAQTVSNVTAQPSHPPSTPVAPPTVAPVEKLSEEELASLQALEESFGDPDELVKEPSTTAADPTVDQETGGFAGAVAKAKKKGA